MQGSGLAAQAAALGGLLLGLSGVAPRAADAPAEPLLLQRPSLSATQIAFDFAGSLWLVACAGGEAHRLTDGGSAAAGRRAES